MTLSPSKEIKLQPPGAGLPFFQGLFLRYWLYPRLIRHYDGDACLESMTRETARIIELSESLSDGDFFRPVLIDPLPGLEDSSRYWSVAMVMEHLIICMKPMTQIVETLARGQSMNINTSPANVKPKGGSAVSRAEWIRLFRDATAECAARLAPVAVRPDVARPAASAPRVSHPFFGPIPAKGWIWVLGAHPVTHRRQVQRIIKGLEQSP